MAFPNRYRYWLAKVNKIQEAVDNADLGSPHQTDADQYDKRCQSSLTIFDTVVTSQTLRNSCRRLFIDGHYAVAVENAFKVLNNTVKAKACFPDTAPDGTKLMLKVFSPNKPVLLLNTLKTTSEKDEQTGYMKIFAGVMMGIRNPRAHEHNLEDDLDVALELLTLANHLMRMLDRSTKRDLA